MLSNLALHDKALTLAKTYLETENALLELLNQIDARKVYRELGYGSLYDYCLRALNLSEGQSYALIGVSRKCQEVPELKAAIQTGKLTVSKAKRILPALAKCSSAAEASESAIAGPGYWIEKAATLPQRKVEQLVAEGNLERVVREKIRPITATQVELRCALTPQSNQKLERVRQLLSQQKGRSVTMAEAIDAMATIFLEKNDPAEKAKRALEREGKRANTSPSKVLPVPRQVNRNLAAKVKHAVWLRDQGRCRHPIPGGARCDSRVYLHFHHKIPFHQGGPSTADNLVLLCANHHRRVHEMASQAIETSEAKATRSASAPNGAETHPSEAAMRSPTG